MVKSRAQPNSTGDNQIDLVVSFVSDMVNPA